MIEQARALALEYADLQRKIQDPAVFNNPKELTKISKRMKELEAIVELLRGWEECEKILLESKAAENDPELTAIAIEEGRAALLRKAALEEKIQAFLVPRDPRDDRNAILEIRAGTGGDEAALFAGDLCRMYLRYAEGQRWKTEILDSAPSEHDGYKNVVLRVEGKAVFGALKFEGGVHRVQRIPTTEAKGRVHTSTATVAVLPEAEEVDVPIRNEDLKIDTFRASGAGGQHVNKTESAIRITHVPTGVVVACQSERSQLQNRMRAMEVLRTRLWQLQEEKHQQEQKSLRSSQVRSADRSEKIRTYNVPQDRLTDHRLEQNFHNLPAIFEGDLQDIIEALKKWEAQERVALGRG